MSEIFEFVKYNDSVPEGMRRKIVKNLYYEIQKQAEKEKHSKGYLLYLILNYEDIYDLVEVFLTD